MKESLEKRLAALEAESHEGQRMLADLDARRQSLTATLLRIEGASQVIRELLRDEELKPSAK